MARKRRGSVGGEGHVRADRRERTGIAAAPDNATACTVTSAENGKAPPNERAARILADLQKFREMDPLGPEGWEAIRQHIKRHGLYIGSEE